MCCGPFVIEQLSSLFPAVAVAEGAAGVALGVVVGLMVVVLVGVFVGGPPAVFVGSAVRVAL